MPKLPCLVGLISAASLLASCGENHGPGRHSHGGGSYSPSTHADSGGHPYPLKTCVVSGKELGSSGAPVTVTYKGHEIKLCSKACEQEFEKEPEKYAKKLADAWRARHETHGSHETSKAAPASNATPVGGKIPGFEVADLAGKTWTLSDLQEGTDSGVVSLTFWCTFCHSCRTMEARLQKMAEDFKGRASVVGVDASAADTPKKIEDFTRDKKFTFPVLLDAQGMVADLFGVKLTTTTLIIDKAGVLRYRGQFDGGGVSHAENAIRSVLEGKEVAVQETPPAG